MIKSHPVIRALKPIISRLSISHSASHLNMHTQLPPRNIVLDFDGTIITKDTIFALANFGIKYQKVFGQEMTSAWDEILSSYSGDYSAHNKNYLPRKEDRKTLAQEIEYYRSLREVETRSFERVSKSGIFKGISDDMWRKAGREMIESGEVEVRKGFREFMFDMRRRGGRFGLVSVNFSRDFIQGVLEASAGAAAADVEVLANSADEEGVISGPAIEGTSVMTTSDAKLLSMRKLLSLWDDALEVSSRRKPIYVGDSGTDIECLLDEKVVGIVMSDDEHSNLMETLQRVQMKVERCAGYEEGKDDMLYYGRNFDDIRNSSLFSVSTEEEN